MTTERPPKHKRNRKTTIRVTVCPADNRGSMTETVYESTVPEVMQIVKAAIDGQMARDQSHQK